MDALLTRIVIVGVVVVGGCRIKKSFIYIASNSVSLSSNMRWSDFSRRLDVERGLTQVRHGMHHAPCIRTPARPGQVSGSRQQLVHIWWFSLLLSLWWLSVSTEEDGLLDHGGVGRCMPKKSHATHPTRSTMPTKQQQQQQQQPTAMVRARCPCRHQHVTCKAKDTDHTHWNDVSGPNQKTTRYGMASSFNFTRQSRDIATLASHTTNTNTALGWIRPQSMHCYAVKKICLQLFAILDCELNDLHPD